MTAGETPIRDPAALAARVASWQAAGPIALDTEFVRERTYYPKLCLIQAASLGDIVIVDAIELEDGGALLPLITDRGRRKILHAARQDIEALLPITNTPLAPVFDTQQAAALLGFPSQVGYAELVRRVLGIELAKGHARTDWARRPLSAEQLSYAVEDVRHLPALADALERRLDAAGRRAWLEEEAASLDDVTLYRVDPSEAWRRLKGLERLDAAALAVTRSLAEWREWRAMARNLPRRWVLPDAAIFELAQSRPASREALSRVAALPRGTALRAGEELLAAIATADDSAARAVQDTVRPGPEELRRQRRLQDRLASIATELGIQPEVLATRRELAALARGAQALPVLSGWRKAVVGEPLLAAL
jgi:ribonuclease D